MKEFIDTYYKSKEKVESFAEGSIHSLGELSQYESAHYDVLFQTFHSLELVYVVDNKSKLQISPNIYPKKLDKEVINTNRDYLIERLDIRENGFGFTAPYKSNATQNLCITVTKKEGDKIIYMDFNLSVLLERMGLIEKHAVFSGIERYFYAISGFFMMAIALSAILYAGIDFVGNILNLNLDIHTIFKPIIAATLGLAIFDLAKTVLEQEVFFKSYSKDEKAEVKVLTKFLFTILIALSIETLMVVFKIAMQENGEMINALYLMSGISFIILSLSAFIYLTGSKQR